jgi:AraC-like DNA-binding protein
VFSANYFGALNELFVNHKTVSSFFNAAQWRPLIAGDGESALCEFCVSSGADALTRSRAYTHFMSFLFGILEECGVEAETQEEKLYRAAVGYCLENYKNPLLHVQDVASALGISKATLCRLFSQRHGGVKAFINQARVEYAMVLLRTTEIGVAQVAEKAGFVDVSVFYRAFKRRFGYAPSESR